MKICVFALVVASLAFVSAGGVGADEPFGVSYRQSMGEDFRPSAHVVQASAQPQAIIGVDEREQVLDTTVYPFSAIAYLNLTTASGGGSCTGTFVGPDVLLTAAHCLWGVDDGFTQAVSVTPGKDNAFEPFGSEEAFDWVVPQEWIDSAGNDTLWDFGIIVMNDGTLGNTVGWLAVASMLTDTLSRPDFTPGIIGYPGDIGDGTTMMGNVKDSFKSVSDFLVEYEIDTAPGQSGSAVLSLNFEEYFLGYVVAIHTTGGATENHGTRIEEVTLERLLDMCTEFGCEMEAYTETTGASNLWVDADCDGELSTRDNQAILRVVLSQPQLSQTQPCTPIGEEVSVEGYGDQMWADADCDGELTTRDNQALLRKVLSQAVLSQMEPCPDVGSEVGVS